jgi:hypothetical protein
MISRGRLAIAAVLGLVAIAAWTTASSGASFTASKSNPSNSFTASSSFHATERSGVISSPFGGMNEHGLWFDAFSAPPIGAGASADLPSPGGGRSG